jgi:hypothetical protein
LGLPGTGVLSMVLGYLCFFTSMRYLWAFYRFLAPSGAFDGIS